MDWLVDTGFGWVLGDTCASTASSLLLDNEDEGHAWSHTGTNVEMLMIVVVLLSSSDISVSIDSTDAWFSPHHGTNQEWMVEA